MLLISFWTPLIDPVTNVLVAIRYMEDEDGTVRKLGALAIAVIVLSSRHRGSLMLYMSDWIHRLLYCGGRSEIRMTLRVGFWLYVPFVGTWVTRKERYGLVVGTLLFAFNEYVTLVAAVLAPLQILARAISYTLRVVLCLVPLRNLQEEMEEHEWLRENGVYNAFECIFEAFPMAVIKLVVIAFYRSGGVPAKEWASFAVSCGVVGLSLYGAVCNAYERKGTEGLVGKRLGAVIERKAAKELVGKEGDTDEEVASNA